MAEEIEMWKERALLAERLLAELSAGSRRPGKGGVRRLGAVRNHPGQAEGSPPAVVLFDLDSDVSAA